MAACDLPMTCSDRLVMPGMGGRALAHELPQAPGDESGLYVWLHGQGGGTQEPIDPGSDFLSKPFTRELGTQDREALDRRMVAQSK